MSPGAAGDASAERWLSVALRTAHLVGVVWVGAALLAGQPASLRSVGLMAGSGVALLLVDLRAHRIALGELAGAVVLLKLALLGWMALDARHASWIFCGLLVLSSISSHAPRSWRHWPRQSRSRRGADCSAP